MGIQTKHFINSPSALVLESLEGLCKINPHLSLDPVNKVVYLNHQDHSKVALICGGGSGHEPAHSGFVGEGMLTAAVCGNIFASPGSSQVRRGIDLVSNEKGTLIIVKNYTGDVLNFGLAKEQYAALNPRKADSVKFLVVGDDVAVGRTQGSIVGRRCVSTSSFLKSILRQHMPPYILFILTFRSPLSPVRPIHEREGLTMEIHRGLAGVVLVYKIAGALARAGAELDEVYNVSEWVANHIATSVPGTAAASSDLKESEIEIGLGIHNESGNKRISPVPSLHDLVQQLLGLLLSTSDPERSFVPFTGKGDHVVLMVNNLGGLSELELCGIVREVESSLVGRQVGIARVLSGSFMTSLNMPGFSITLLQLPSEAESVPSADLILRLLDAPTSAPGWPWSSRAPPTRIFAPSTAQSLATSDSAPGTGKVKLPAQDPKAFDAAIERACRALNAAEPEITRMDSIAGDGDCGLTLQTGANAVLEELKKGNAGGDDVVGTAIVVSNVAADKMGGTSGALYSRFWGDRIFFSALAQGLQSEADGKTRVATREVWAAALASALGRLYTYTRARPPSRTLVDPVAAFVDAFSKNPDDVSAAVSRAAEAAEKTRDVEAKAGRSAYVEGDRLRKERIPDPGAWGVKVVLEAVVGV
ncbi:hypothetical protein EW146_g62 [Bondarzewia mesenterica]|uniref:Dihydroxyacetone kinase n=1 Tax=Bondarzewia mesenterica TaxID=1095465 RepID=A0A4S4MEG0_9AGAM|nr:hypothetical protein EW146_g62 [Bondarzewia mesenterica]